MTLKNFQHVSASSLKEASAILARARGTAAVIAGGTDLLGVLKDHVHPNGPEILVDLKTIPGLSYIRSEENRVRIGALTPLCDIVNHPGIRETMPVLAQAARSVASPQIRNMGTLGGNLCQEPRCWYYRTPENHFNCLRKGGNRCDAIFGDNRYHSIFGGVGITQPGCAKTCPGNVEIPVYMGRIRQGDIDGAAEVLLSSNPIPAITGRICPHLCESRCNRRDVDEAVGIRDAERFLGDHVLDHAAQFMSPPQKERKERVAIVGSGPAGLSAAFYLRKEGFQVTVFEKMPMAGGMLTYGIPGHRLSKAVVERQVQALAAMGIEFRLNTALGQKDTTLKALRKRFDHVFLAVGAWGPRPLQIEKSALLTPGLEFLVQICSGQTPAVGKKVLVIGGGNVAVDVAISARHLGAEEVTMVCLEARDQMPAFEEELQEALKAGVRVVAGFGPRRIEETDGRITGLELIRCTAVFDETGRFNPSFDPGETRTLEADQIILAIGQSTDLSFAGDDLETERGLIVIDEESRKTSIKHVLAGGDVASGPASVIHAIAAGRKAAFSIARKKPVPHLSVGAPLEAGKDALTPSARTGCLTCAADIEREAARCINCGCVAVNVSDMAPALIALDALVVTTRRTIEAAEFFRAGVMKSTVLDADELVQEIEIPRTQQMKRQGYEKFRIRNAIDFPIVSLAYAFDMAEGKVKDARIVLGAVASIPLRVPAAEAFLEGKAADPETAASIGEVAAQEVSALSKNTFKVQIVKALLRKMILRANASV